MEIQIVVEDPRGSTLRHFWDEGEERWIEKPHPHSQTPWPANYGYIIGTWNDVDEDELDALIISTDPIETGASISARAVGLLLRPDGDDKILTVPIDDPIFGAVERFDQVPAEQIQSIDDWFAEWSQIGQWRDENGASSRIQKAQQAAS
jgi:inorganic pyrophosphatase